MDLLFGLVMILCAAFFGCMLIVFIHEGIDYMRGVKVGIYTKEDLDGLKIGDNVQYITKDDIVKTGKVIIRCKAGCKILPITDRIDETSRCEFVKYENIMWK